VYRLFLFLCLPVSHHVLAVMVEVNEGERSVLLPCQYSGLPPVDPTVTWTRNDLNPNSVHVRQEETDDLRGQNQRYSGRTSMRPDALDSGDFSLTLKNLQLTDSGKYACTLSNERNKVRVGDVQLQVKGQQYRCPDSRTNHSPTVTVGRHFNDTVSVQCCDFYFFTLSGQTSGFF
uniref:Ig-like domain-containing protein n=1 Tax=Maylandia zebra TaxID=106582 RepID=A0A3P9DLS8_9CICH